MSSLLLFPCLGKVERAGLATAATGQWQHPPRLHSRSSLASEAVVVAAGPGMLMTIC